MNLSSAMQLLRVFAEADIPAFLWGPPGIGKSDGVRKVAADMGINCFDFRAITVDPVDLRGLPKVEGDWTRWTKTGLLPIAERDGPRGLLFLDELNTAPAGTMNACLGLVLDRKIGEYRLPAGWIPVAAGNRQADRAAVQRVPTPLLKRFAHIEIEADLRAWSLWANSAGVSAAVVAFLQFRPALLHTMPEGEAKASADPRNWVKVGKIVDSCPAALRQAAIAAIVGPGPAGELEGFLRIWHTLPPIAEIIANPDSAMVPRSNDAASLYAIAGALGRKADRGNVERIFRYGARLPREYSILLAIDAVKRDATLATTAAFVAWARANQDVAL